MNFDDKIRNLLARQELEDKRFDEAETSAGALSAKTCVDRFQRDVDNVATLARVQRDMAFARLANVVASLLEKV